MTDSATAMATIQSIQLALQMIQTLTPTAWMFPAECPVKDGDAFDYIVVGGGSAGSVVASRLTENKNINVLLVEAGGYPPIESVLFPGWFTYLAQSPYDYNFTSVNNGRTAQNLQGKVLGMTQGKMLGGSSGLHHMMHSHGDPEDFNAWANMTNDINWSYKKIQKYFKKLENLIDKDILASKYASLHGTDGPTKITRETYESNKKYLEAFAELGHKIVLDVTSTESTIGFVESLLQIADGIRQSAALGYLGLAKSRPNLCLSLFTTANKVLVNKGTAYGIQATNSRGKTIKVYAKKEVILSAGAINTPKLLMLSGIGPKEHLTSLGIDVIADLPVGENLQDHTCAVVMYALDECNTTNTASNPHAFPARSFNGYVALKDSQTYADYESINMDMQCSPQGLLHMNLNVFKYSYNISQTLYDVAKERNILYSMIGLMMAKSRGKITLTSKDPAADPRIETGILTNCDDIDLLVRAFIDHNRILNTTYFKSVNAEMIDFGICKDAKTELEYWKCYIFEMSVSMWHYTSSCAMGKVLNSKLEVMGVRNLRVIDSSAMPTVTRGEIYAGVMVLAERGADLIKATWC